VLLWTALLLLLGFKTLSCDSSLSSCLGSSCAGSTGGMTTLNYAQYPVGQKIVGLGDVRLTSAGLAFIGAHAVDILKQAMGGSLSFAIPSGSILNCVYGGNTVTINIDHVEVVPTDQKKLTMNIYLPADFLVTIPASCDLLLTTYDCDLSVDTKNTMLEISVDLTLRIDADTRRIDPRVKQVMASLAAVHEASSKDASDQPG